MKQIIKIAFTGGPCSGKTTVIAKLKETFENAGYKVIIISETASELIASGFYWFDNSIKTIDFQHAIFAYQLFKENLAQKLAEEANYEKVIMLCDRGLMDGKAYISEEGFSEIISNHGMTEEVILSRYDMVIYLMSVANSFEDQFTHSNNHSRKSNVEQAKAFDLGVKAAWNNHSNLHYIYATELIEDKERATIDAVKSYLLQK